MEYMPHGDLFNLLHKEPKTHHISLLQRLRMAKHVSLGVNTLHCNGILHRDIKSMNILVTDDFSCKLTDLGLAKIFGDNHSGLHTLNTGTPVWMAPEVKTGVYSYSADVYSLGLVLFEFFVGNLTHYWNPAIQALVLPLTFKAESIIKPCINPFPQARPTAHQLVQFLNEHMQNLLKIVMNKMYANDSQRFGSAAADTDAAIGLLYRHLLSIPALEADEIVNSALKKA